MKRLMRIVLGMMVVLMVAIVPADAARRGHGGHFGHRGGHGGFSVFVGPGLLWPGWWGPYPYYPYYPAPPVIVQQPSELYVQPNPQVEEPGYWYFCQEPQGYYPYVKKCPKGWMQVVPPANPPE